MEDEDAASSEEEEEEDHSSLARELNDLSKAAGEEKITSEDAALPPPTSVCPPSTPSSTRRGSAASPCRTPRCRPCSQRWRRRAARLRIIAILSDFLRSVIALTPVRPPPLLCTSASTPSHPLTKGRRPAWAPSSS